MERLAFSRGELGFLVGVPLAWAVLLLFHPGGEGDQIYQDLHDKVTRWMVVHVGMLVFIPLFGAVVYVLVRGIEGSAALVSRIGLAVFVVFYGAFELLQGIGVGILVNEIQGFAQVGETTRADLVQDFAEHPIGANLGVFGSIGGLGLAVAMIAAGVALRRHAGAPIYVAILLGLSGFLIGAHPPPYGPTGLGLFILAVLLFVRSQSAQREPAPLGPAPP
jgi:hypothetical protein